MPLEITFTVKTKFASRSLNTTIDYGDRDMDNVLKSFNDAVELAKLKAEKWSEKYEKRWGEKHPEP